MCMQCVTCASLPQVIKLRQLGPTTVEEWQEEGRVHFTAQDYSRASDCYTSALKLLLEPNKGGCSNSTTTKASSSTTTSSTNSSNSRGTASGRGVHSSSAQQDNGPRMSELLSILLNLSAVKLKLLEPTAALMYAHAARQIDLTSVKASYRQALALGALGHAEAARAMMEVAIGLQEQQEGGREQGLSGVQVRKESAVREKFLADLKDAVAAAARGNAAAAAAAAGGWGTMERQGWSEGEQRQGEVEASRVTARAVTEYLQQKQQGGMGAVNQSSSSGRGGREQGEAAAELKEGGNAAFKSGDYPAAAAAYEAALLAEQAAAATASTLLSNRAACALPLGKEHWHAAVADATAAVVLNPSLVKGHYRRAKGLLQLGLIAEAQEACVLGLRLEPKEHALLQLKERLGPLIKHQAAAAAAAGGAGGGGGGKQVLEGEEGMMKVSAGGQDINSSSSSSSNRNVMKQAGNSTTSTATKGSSSVESSSTSSRSASSRESGGSRGQQSVVTAKGTKYSTAKVDRSAASKEPQQEQGRKQKQRNLTEKEQKEQKQEPQQRNLTEKELAELEAEGAMEVEQLAAHNDTLALMMRFRPPGGPRLPLWMMPVDERVPKFHLEFTKQGRWVWVGFLFHSYGKVLAKYMWPDTVEMEDLVETMHFGV